MLQTNGVNTEGQDDGAPGGEGLDKKNSQPGFMGGRSCTTNLLEFFDEVTKAVDEGSPVDVVFLDFAKAFHKVPRRRLVAKLEAHGI